MFTSRRVFLLGSVASVVAFPANAQSKPSVGIIFIGFSTCPYCAVVAPILYDLQRQTGMDILCVSVDDQPIYPFHDWQDGSRDGTINRYPTVPHLMIYNRALDGVTHELSGIRTSRSFINRLALSLRQSSEMS